MPAVAVAADGMTTGDNHGEHSPVEREIYQSARRMIELHDTSMAGTATCAADGFASR